MVPFNIEKLLQQFPATESTVPGVPVGEAAKNASVIYSSDDENFLVRGVMDLSPYVNTGYLGIKKSDYRICDLSNLKKQDAGDDFVVHDTSKVTRRPLPKSGMRRFRTDRNQKMTKHELNKPAADVVATHKKIATAPISRYEKQKLKQRRQERPAMFNRPKIYFEWSIKPDPTWSLMKELSLNELAKNGVDSSKVTVKDIARRGVIPLFNKSWEKITPKSTQSITRSGIIPHKPGFFEDNYLLAAADPEEGEDVDVLITDEVLTLLMSASHTRYSWHIKIFKTDGKIILDKAPDTIVEKVTVRESSRQFVPVLDDPIALNRPKELHDEATALQVDVCQMLIGNDAQKFEDPSFEMENPNLHDNQGRKMYKYREFTIPPVQSKRGKDIKILTRVEIDAVRVVSGKPQYILVKCMNEYDYRAGSYRIQLDKTPGALTAAEYRNNSPTMARWISQAILSDAETLVLAWATREQAHDNKKHLLLGCMTEKVELLQQQLGVKPRSVWGMVRSIIDAIMDDSCEDGEYVLVKEPLKPIMRLLFVGSLE